MKRYSTLLLVVLSLALVATAFAGDRKIALLPTEATVHIGGPDVRVDFEAFCNQTPCNIQWYIVLSNSEVGKITNTSGPTTTFLSGSVPGTAIVFVSDGMGNLANAKITVMQ